jgi:hypothetical protein
MLPITCVDFLGGALYHPVRCWLTLGAGLLGLTLLTGCSQGPPNPANVPEAKPQATDNELHFDRCYLDTLSLGLPYSFLNKCELAVLLQLKRLEIAKNRAPRHLMTLSLSM